MAALFFTVVVPTVYNCDSKEEYTSVFYHQLKNTIAG